MQEWQGRTAGHPADMKNGESSLISTTYSFINSRYSQEHMAQKAVLVTGGE